MTRIAERVSQAITAAGVPILGSAIGDPADKGTWKVNPASLQAAAQPTITAFDVNDPAHDSAQLNLAVTGHLDTERIYSALAWAIIDTYSPPATIAKYQTARTKIISAYRLTPWK